MAPMPSQTIASIIHREGMDALRIRLFRRGIWILISYIVDIMTAYVVGTVMVLIFFFGSLLVY